MHIYLHYKPPGWAACLVMCEYELELISQHLAQRAQNPLLTPFATLNKMNGGKAPFPLANQPLAATRRQNTERYKKNKKDEASILVTAGAHL